MLSSELKERGGQLIDELDLRRGSTTEKWMVHYVVELMQRAEHADSEEERLQAATRCADVIRSIMLRMYSDSSDHKSIPASKQSIRSASCRIS